MKPRIDKEYEFNLETRLKDTRSFHKYYKTKGHDNPNVQISEHLE
jgi:hypothetical protein